MSRKRRIYLGHFKAKVTLAPLSEDRSLAAQRCDVYPIQLQRWTLQQSEPPMMCAAVAVSTRSTIKRRMLQRCGSRWAAHNRERFVGARVGKDSWTQRQQLVDQDDALSPMRESQLLAIARSSV